MMFLIGLIYTSSSSLLREQVVRKDKQATREQAESIFLR